VTGCLLPGCYAPVTRTCAAAMAAEAPRAIATLGGCAGWRLARTCMGGGVDGFTVAVAVGLVVVEVGFVGSGISVSERSRRVKGKKDGQED